MPMGERCRHGNGCGDAGVPREGVSHLYVFSLPFALRWGDLPMLAGRGVWGVGVLCGSGVRVALACPIGLHLGPVLALAGIPQLEAIGYACALALSCFSPRLMVVLASHDFAPCSAGKGFSLGNIAWDIDAHVLPSEFGMHICAGIAAMATVSTLESSKGPSVPAPSWDRASEGLDRKPDHVVDAQCDSWAA